MQCPNCHHVVQDKSLFCCADCGQTFERELIEEYAASKYLAKWLEDRKDRLGADRETLLREVYQDQESLLKKMELDFSRDQRHLRCLDAAQFYMTQWCTAGLLPSYLYNELYGLVKKEKYVLEQRGVSAVSEWPSEIETFQFVATRLEVWKRSQLGLKLANDQNLASGMALIWSYIQKTSQTAMRPAAQTPEESIVMALAKLAQAKELAGNGQFATALSTCDEALALTPSLVKAHVLRGLLLDALGNNEQARSAYEQAVRLDLNVSRAAAKELRAIIPSSPDQAAVRASKPVQPAALKPAQAPPVIAKPIRPAAPARPIKPPAPPIDIGKAMQTLAEKSVQALVSGALTRALLYLGALMIVVTLTALVLAFWKIFPAPVQVGFIFLVPTLFYVAGWGIRTRMRLPQASTVMLAIGAMIFALDFAAIYQLGGLQVPIAVYWLVASTICLLIYTLTTWLWERSEVFGYLTLIAFMSTIGAVVMVITKSLGWSLAASGVVGPVGAALSVMLREREKFKAVSLACIRFAWLALGAVILAALAWRGEPGWAGRMTMVVAWGVLLSMLLAIWYPWSLHIYAGASLLMATICFLFVALDLVSWIPLGILICSAFLVSMAHVLIRRLPHKLQEATAQQSGETAGQNASTEDVDPQAVVPVRTSPFASYPAALQQSGLLAWSAGALCSGIFGLISTWEPGFAMTGLVVSALLLGAYSFVLNRPALLFWAGMFTLLPVAYAWKTWMVPNPAWDDWRWLFSIWLVIGLAALVWVNGLGHKGSHARMLIVFSTLTTLVALATLLTGSWEGLPLIILIGLCIIYYANAFVMHARGNPAVNGVITQVMGTRNQIWQPGIYLWPLVVLLPLEVGIVWGELPMVTEWLGPVLASLGIAYVAGAGGVSRLKIVPERRFAYRMPLHVLAYGLAIAGVIFSLVTAPMVQSGSVIAAGFLAAAVLVGQSILYKRGYELYLAAPLSLAACLLIFANFDLAETAWGLVWAVLASGVYFSLGIILDRPGRQYALPFYLTAWAAGLVATVIGSVQASFSPLRTLAEPQWPAVASLWICTILLVASQIRLQTWHIFAWLTPLWIIAAFAPSISLLGIPDTYATLAWAVLCTVQVVLAWSAGRRVIIKGFRLPLATGAAVIGLISLLISLWPSANLFLASKNVVVLPLLLAQGTLAVASILSAGLFRKHWLIIPFPFLAWLTVTVFFAGYSATLFGSALSTAQYALVWAGLALLFQALAAWLGLARLLGIQHLDDWIWFAGYGLSSLTVIWTNSDLQILVWSLAGWIVGMAGSAVLHHKQLHRAWENWTRIIINTIHPMLKDVTLITLAVAPVPLWWGILLTTLDAPLGMIWFGVAGAALATIGLAALLKPLNARYSPPLNLIAHGYTLVSLLVCLPANARLLSIGTRAEVGSPQFLDDLGFVLVQTAGVAVYAFWAALKRRRFFSLIAASLSFLPYTLAWIIFQAPLSTAQFAWVWLGLAVLLLGLAFGLDRRTVRHSHSLYAVGYVLVLFSLLWSFQERVANLVALGVIIGLSLFFQWVEHNGRHLTWNDLHRWLNPSGDRTVAVFRILRSAFLWIAAVLVPVGLAQLLSHFDVPLAWRGVSLALIAPLYVAAGLGARRLRDDYAWPLYGVGYLLSALGAMVSFENEALSIYVLLLNTVLYGVSALIFNQPFWLYLATGLAPITALLTLHYNHLLISNWVASILMIFAWVYFVTGQMIQRSTRKLISKTGEIARMAGPFFLLAFVLSATALAVGSGERLLAIWMYLLGVALYGLAAWFFREALFLYPASWLAVVPYFLVMSMTALDPIWYGLGWLPLIIGYLMIGRLVFHRRPVFEDHSDRSLLQRTGFLAHPAVPFYLVVYGLIVNMIVLSAQDARLFTAALVAATLLYFVSARIFRHPAWFYPALLCAHMGLLAYFTIAPSDAPVQMISLPFHILTWVVTGLGVWAARFSGKAQALPEGRYQFTVWKWKVDFGRLTSFGHLITPSWAQPLFIFAGLDMILWQGVAMGYPLTTLMVSAGTVLLLALLATYWQDALLPYLSVFVLIIGMMGYLEQVGVAGAMVVASLAVLGFALYLIGLLIDTVLATKLPGMWALPLARSSKILAVVSVLLSLVGSLLNWTAIQQVALAASLAFSGILFLTDAYRGRIYRLGYVAVGMLLVAWTIFLLRFGQSIPYPQLYAIPFGLYFILVGELERKAGGQKLYARLLEMLGVAVLLISSFAQSLNGKDGFPYFVLMLAEGLVVIYWGTQQRRRLPFLFGLIASFVNVISQIIVLLNAYNVSNLFIFLGLGSIILVGGVLIERRREHLIRGAQAWREGLDTWE